MLFPDKFGFEVYFPAREMKFCHIIDAKKELIKGLYRRNIGYDRLTLLIAVVQFAYVALIYFRQLVYQWDLYVCIYAGLLLQRL